ncbi:histidine kinase dimerization/phosphoacceptor domain -containing protein [Sphingomicrobium sp. XHP0235]|uniref:sensor histidine kinase n=1 Tax=Sphingomicrobium aquimarinum TaxID=3133971 RepID=UPI0031FECCBC
MSSSFSPRSTPFKLFLALTLALLPIGALIMWATISEFEDRRGALRGSAQGDMLVAARSIEGLLGRNTLALRIAAYGALTAGEADPCDAVRETLSITPAVQRDFRISSSEGDILCGTLEPSGVRPGAPPEPGEVDLWVNRAGDGLYLSIGIPGAIATGRIDRSELAEAIAAETTTLSAFSVSDGARTLEILSSADAIDGGRERETLEIDIARQRLTANASADFNDITLRDRAIIFLPIAMWAIAAVLSWALVHFLLMRPLRRLTGAVRDYDPETHNFVVPEKLGTAHEIRDLGDSFADTVRRIEESEGDLLHAVDNQKKLVREVHHRVKNNLQVVASLLNIHSRGVEGEEARAAYAGIGRRVEALAVVHRNHFAEVEETRGIQLRPLVTELAASLRASAPQGISIDFSLDLDAAATTQDAAVSAAFFVTEVVEHAFDRGVSQSIEIALRRTSELTARLAVASEALIGDEGDADGHRQFERIIDGLSRQLRSPLDKKLGSYAVELPVFPEDKNARPA